MVKIYNFYKLQFSSFLVRLKTLNLYYSKFLLFYIKCTPTNQKQ